MDKLFSAFSVAAPPIALFRFHHSSGIPALTEDTLKVGAPAKFNDPFEMSAGIAREGLTDVEVLRSVTSERMFRVMMRKMAPHILTSETLYNETVTKILREEPGLGFGHLESIVKSIMLTIRGEPGIACFSAFTESEIKGPIGIRHWAAYADSHEGFAIEDDGAHEFFQRWANLELFFPVQYIPRRNQTKLEDFDNWDDLKMWHTIRSWSQVKSSEAWGNDREWRLLSPSLESSPRLSNQQTRVRGQGV